MGDRDRFFSMSHHPSLGAAGDYTVTVYGDVSNVSATLGGEPRVIRPEEPGDGATRC